MSEERIEGVSQVVSDIANMMGRKLDQHSKDIIEMSKKLNEVAGDIKQILALLSKSEE